MKLIIEKIKFSYFRDTFKNIKFIFKKLFANLLGLNFLWNGNFESFINNPKAKILLFAPSMTLDKPNYLNVGLRNLIEEGKLINVEVEVMQCVGGLDICHLGGSPFSSSANLPCKSCSKVNSELYKDLKIIKFSNIKKNYDLSSLNFEELKNFNYKKIELGQKSLTSIAWILRTPEITDKHYDYLKKSIKSGIKLIDYLETLDLSSFDGVIVFNGLTLPESIMYDWCLLNNINVATFESGWSINNEYALEFSYKPTPQHFFKFEKRTLNENEELKIQNYLLEKRSQFSEFTTQDKRKIISIFGNVSWDTTQVISSTIFNSMFNWLDSLVPIINENKDYLFVFRAHPGENRNIKETWYGLDKWYEKNKHKIYSNSICYSTNDNVDSYEILEKSELVLVYNSTIGIESTMFGKKVLAAANTHYSKVGIVDSYKNRDDYIDSLKSIIEKEIFNISDAKSELAKSYYFQLLNDVAYNFGNINFPLSFQEHTLIENYKVGSHGVANMSKFIENFIERNPIEKKFNL